MVFDSGTTAIVNMALTFKNTGTINTYAQAFDRQNVAGALQTSSIYVPPNSFSLTSVSAFSVQQAGTPAAFTLNVPASGTFSGQVQLSYTAPAGVGLSFEANPLTATAASSTSVQVTASASAAVGPGTITVTGTSGSLTATQTIAITVLPPTPPPAAPSSFTITSQTTSVSVQQAGNTAQLMLNFAATNFSGTVSLSASATNNVTVTLPASVTVPATSGATVLVSAPSNATLGSGTITITGTGTGATYSLTIPVTVTQAPPPPPPPANPTFVISGNSTGTQTLNVASITSTATFTLAFTGLNGFPATQQIAVSVDPVATSTYISASLSAGTVYAGGSIQVTLEGSPLSPSGFLCATIDADSGSIQTAATLCVNATTASPNISFAVPQPSPNIVVPPGGNTTIVGSVSSTISNPTVSFTQYVTCPAGVSPCDGSATFSTLTNGSVTITLNSGHIPQGTVYTQHFLVNGEEVQDIPIGCDPIETAPSNNAPSLTSLSSPFTYNDNSISQPFYYVCSNCVASQFAANACSSGNPGLYATVGYTDPSSTNIYLTFQASPSEALGNHQINCILSTGQLVSAGYVQVESPPQTPSVSTLQITQATTGSAAVDGNGNPTPPAPAATALSSTGNGLAFASPSTGCTVPGSSPTGLICLVLSSNSGTVTVNANPLPASAAGQLRWVMMADTSNFTYNSNSPATSVPSISGTTGAQTTFQPNLAGDFLLVVYLDSNGNGKFDPGEQLQTVQIAIVQATIILSYSAFTRSNTLAGSGTSSIVTTQDRLLLPGHIPIYLQAWYLLQGGGATQTVGTSGIVIGDVGNLIADGFQVNYLSSPDGMETEVPGGPLPMLDTLNTNSSAGGQNVFRLSTGPANANTSPPLPSAGALLGIMSGDAPTWTWDFTHFSSDWYSTEGAVSFVEFIAAFSNSFPLTYVALNQASWALVLSGDNDSGWEPDGNAAVTGDTQWKAVTAAMQVLGPSYSLSNKPKYTQ